MAAAPESNMLRRVIRRESRFALVDGMERIYVFVPAHVQ